MLAPPAHRLHGGDRQRVVDLDAVLDAGLADEAEHQLVPGAADVPALERGQPEAAVVVGVDVVADPEVAEVEQPYGGRGGPLERHPVEREVLQHGGAGRGEPAGHLGHPLELQLVAPGAPVRVVEVLPAAGVVGADRLEVAVRERADPDVLPRGRDHQRLDPRDVLGRQPGAGVVEVDEALAGAAAGPSPRAGGDGAEADHGRRFPRGSAPNGGCSVGAGGPDHGAHGLGEDHQVAGHRPVVDVVEVEPHRLVPAAGRSGRRPATARSARAGRAAAGARRRRSGRPRTGSGGRGPTRLISPRSTLNSWGSSSSE